MNILLVEDHVTDLKLAQSVLEKAGHHVTAARSAEEAMDIATRDRPQLILTDLILPLMNGIEMVQLLKHTPKLSSIPVIAVSSHLDDFPKRSLVAAGFAACIAKPINTRTLNRQLIETLG